MTVFQGIIAGCATAYLKEPEKKHTCTRVALQANHALLLAAETIRLTGTPLGAFGTAIKVLGAATSLAVKADLYSGKAFLSEETMSKISNIYQASVVGISVATLVLGNPAFAISTLSVLTLDTLLENKNEVFSAAKRVGGFLALIGYGMMSAAAEGVLAGLNTLSAVIVGLESLSKLETSPKISGGVYHHSTDVIVVDNTCHHDCSSHSTVNYNQVSQVAEPVCKLIGEAFCRPSVWN